MKKQKVVILGSGFAGMFAAKHLRAMAPKEVDILLVNEENYFVFQPLLPEVAAGNINASDAVSPLRFLLPGVQMHQGSVEGINFTHKTVGVVDVNQHTLIDVSYDHLVLALGQTVDLSRFPGVQEHAITMKTLADAYRLRNHVINTLEHADVTPDQALKRRLLTYVVVGAGFSGVETIGEMKDMLDRTLKYYPNIKKDEIRLVLVEYADRVLQELPKTLSDYAERKLKKRGIEIWLKTATKSASASTVEMDDGRTIKTSTLVATIGTAPLPLIQNLGLDTQWGRVKVNGFLQVPNRENVWALGDAALIPLPRNEKGEERYAAPTAQFAVREAKLLAANILAAIRGKPLREFDFKPMGAFASIGQNKAVAVLLGIRVSGTMAWLLWRSFYLSMIPGLATKIRVMFNWLLDHLFPRSTVKVQLRRRPSARRVRFLKNDIVFQPGQIADGFYTVLEGSFELAIDDPKTGKPYTRILKKGDHFGERVIYGGSLRPGYVKALEDSSCLVVNREDFLTFAKGFKVLDDYFRNYIISYFPEHLRPPSLICDITERNDPTLAKKDRP